MRRTTWWPRHGKSQSKIGQLDRQDRVVQNKQYRERVRADLKMKGKGCLHFLELVFSGTLGVRRGRVRREDGKSFGESRKCR
jgi:hypothetical protein